jgi:hypothetical protein
MTEQELIAHCVNPEGNYVITEMELTWFHDLIRTRPEYNRLRDNEMFQNLSAGDQNKVLHTLQIGPFEELDNLHSTGSAVFGPNRRDAFAFTILGTDRHDIRPWVSHRPYRAFPHFMIAFSLL